MNLRRNQYLTFRNAISNQSYTKEIHIFVRILINIEVNIVHNELS